MFTISPSPGARVWPRGVVFDCDGLLIQTAACWRAAYARVLAHVGVPFSSVDVTRLDGASVGTAATDLTAQCGKRIDASALRARLREEASRTPVATMPGATDLLARLDGALPLAVASNAPDDVVTTMLARCGLAARFNVVVSAERCAAPKPAPDVYLGACEALGVHPSDAVAFEDSEVGARAAVAAGLFVVGVGRGAGRHVDLNVGRIDDGPVLSLFGLHD